MISSPDLGSLLRDSENASLSPVIPRSIISDPNGELAVVSCLYSRLIRSIISNLPPLLISRLAFFHSPSISRSKLLRDITIPFNPIFPILSLAGPWVGPGLNREILYSGILLPVIAPPLLSVHPTFTIDASQRELSFDIDSPGHSYH